MNQAQIDLIRDDCVEILTDAEQFFALRGETIYISGVSGFMGTWLLELIAYLNDAFGFGTRVIGVARNTARLEEKAPHLASRKDIVLEDKDVRNIFEIPSEVSWIIHTAATPDHRLHTSDPLSVITTIIDGTNRLLDAATRLPNLRKFLNISSGQIYGSQPLGMDRVPETYVSGPNCGSVRSVYSEAKRAAETLCQVYKSQFDVPVLSARPFAFIGPYQYLGRPWAINNFIHRALSGDALRIYGDENTVRSYMYPSDMVNWLFKMLIDGDPGTSFNLGSPYGYTLRHVAEHVASHFPQAPSVSVRANPLPHRELVRSKFVPDVDFAREALGLSLTVDFDTAIKRSVQWFQLGRAGSGKD